jgi:ribosome assembly protein YihI (activator of Der GTPase)
MSKNNVIPFPQDEETKDIYEMTVEEIQAHYAAMQEELHALDAKEPWNMISDAYEEWADEHEELEDYLDEILDRMEELCK